MLALNVHLPENLHQAAREVAAHEGLSLDQLIVRALGEKIAALKHEDESQENSSADEELWERLWALVPDSEQQSFVPSATRAS